MTDAALSPTSAPLTHQPGLPGDERPSELETARRFVLGGARFTRAALTLVPIYLSYFVVWVLWKKLGRAPSKERWRELHTKNARRFYALATQMRGGLIKVGQLISARVDIVPRVWVKELSRLQDRVEPTPYEGIYAHLVQQYGRPPEEVFKSIDPTCIAAASFGQVHRAETWDGQAVALKIRYPDIQAQLAVDMALFGIAVPLFNIFIPKVNLSTIYQEMRLALETELDYAQEATFTRTIHRSFQGFQPTLTSRERPPGRVVIPAVLDAYSTESVIATTFFEGFKITDRERMEALGVTATELLELVLNTWTKMMYQDGVFQSDPHPGNLLFNVVDGHTTLCVIDFGQVKILPREFHRKLVASVLAFITRDVDAYAASVVRVGILSEADAERAKPLLREFFEQYYDLSPAEAKKLDFERIREDVEELLSRIEGVHIPNDLVLYGRTFSLLAGLGTALDEHQNLVALAKPFLMQAILAAQSN